MNNKNKKHKTIDDLIECHFAQLNNRLKKEMAPLDKKTYEYYKRAFDKSTF